jgi:dienelactone hydrolase
MNAVLCVTLLFLGQDPLTPYNNDQPPRVLTTLETLVVKDVTVTRLRFESRAIDAGAGPEKVEIFASLCRPTQAGSGQPAAKRPAMLVLHGGGGCAEEARAIGWAARGYVALAPDLPGIGSPDKLQSLGPFRREKYGAGHYRVLNGDVTTCGIFDAVVSGLKALALLRSQPDVDRSRVGIVGVSWGGYMTTMLSGLAGERVAAAFSVYGCGYYDHGSSGGENLLRGSADARQAWLRWLDAGRRAKGIRAPLFFAAAANDFFFFPSAVMATYNDVAGEKNIVWGPNASHAIALPGGTRGWTNDTWVDMEVPWFDWHLRGRGEAFPTIKPASVTRQQEGVRVRFEPTPFASIAETAVYYAPGEQHWLMKQWRRVPGDGRSAVIPVEEPQLPLHWYAVATDRRPVTVATLIQTLDPRSVGFTAADRRVRPWREDFENDPAQRWVRRDRTLPKGATFAFTPHAAHAGKLGLQLTNGYRLTCSGLRGASLAKDGAKGFRLWAKNDSPLFMELVAKPVDQPEVVWRAAVPAAPDWHAAELPWSDFKTATKEPPKLPCAELGQVRLVGPRTGIAQIDDLEELIGSQ